jgi:hypothetical protein
MVVLTLALIPPDSEGLEPRFYCRRLHVAKRIWKGRSLSFYFSKEVSDGIPIAMEFVSAIEAMAVESSFEPLGIIDEKHGGFDIVFLA